MEYIALHFHLSQIDIFIIFFHSLLSETFFYLQVVVCETDTGKKELLSFVMPNQVLPDNIDLKNYLVPVDTIERASGLLLFDKIPKKSFSKINGKSTGLW